MKEKYLRNGRLIVIPRKDAVRESLFKMILDASFEKGKKYCEKEVNERLKSYYDDFAYLRRLMIEYSLMERKTDCSEYWIKYS